jgi:hypothetical protein
MIYNFAWLLGCPGLVAYQYTRDYRGGFTLAAMLLVILPDSIALDIVPSLPLVTVGRLLIFLMILFWVRNDGIHKNASEAPFFRIQAYMVGLYLISTICSPYPLVAGKQWLYYLIESFIFFCIVQSSLKDRSSAERLIDAIGYGLVIVALLGVSERYLGWRLFDVTSGGRYEGGDQRFSWVPAGEADAIKATYKHRILFGIACALGASKFLIDSALRPGKRRPVFSLGLAFLCGASLYFSNSRGPWLAFGLCTVALILLLPRYFLKKALILTALAGLALIVRPGVWESISGMGKTTMDAESVRGASFRWRFLIMKLAVQKIVEANPLRQAFGFGGGSEIMTDFGMLELYPGLSLPAESWDCEFAIILYERGTIGLACIWVLYIGAIFKSAQFLRRQSISPEPAMVFAFSTLLIIFFMMANVAIYAPQLIYINAFALGISSSILARNDWQGSAAEEIAYAA